MTCSSAVWAQELDLMAPDLIERLNGLLRRRVGAVAALPGGLCARVVRMSWNGATISTVLQEF